MDKVKAFFKATWALLRKNFLHVLKTYPASAVALVVVGLIAAAVLDKWVL